MRKLRRIAAIGVLIAAGLSGAAQTTAAPLDGYELPEGAVEARFLEVVDGDTFYADVEVNGQWQEETIRMIGIDTPETKDPRKVVQCFGKEASAEAARRLAGQTVALEADPTQDNIDKYGRLLRYAWLPDGHLFSLEMLIGGFAHEYTYDLPYRYQAAFKKAEHDARERGWGLWAESSCGGDTTQPADGAAPPEQPAPTKASPRPIPLPWQPWPCRPTWPRSGLGAISITRSWITGPTSMP